MDMFYRTRTYFLPEQLFRTKHEQEDIFAEHVRTEQEHKNLFKCRPLLQTSVETSWQNIICLQNILNL